MIKVNNTHQYQYKNELEEFLKRLFKRGKITLFKNNVIAVIDLQNSLNLQDLKFNLLSKNPVPIMLDVSELYINSSYIDKFLANPNVHIKAFQKDVYKNNIDNLLNVFFTQKNNYYINNNCYTFLNKVSFNEHSIEIDDTIINKFFKLYLQKIEIYKLY